MMNQVNIVGRITTDIQLKKTESGKSVVTIFVALNRNYTSNDGIQADYPPIVLWANIAENTAKYCCKGSLVAITGNLRTRKRTIADKDIYVMEVVGNHIQFLDNRNKLKEKDEIVEDKNIYDIADVDVDKDIEKMMSDLAEQIPTE